MRIISNFHDYYDTAMAFHSNTPVYERKTSSHPIEWVGESYVYNHYNIDPRTGILGFCGEIYPFVHFRIKNAFVYTEDDYNEIISKIPPKNKYNMPDIFRTWNKNRTAKTWFNKDFQAFASKNKTVINPKSLFEQYKTPIFAIVQEQKPAYHNIIINPNLSDYVFYRLSDPFSTFQKIEMFLSNELVKPDDPFIQPIPDEIKAQSHGFNQFSFRKEKSKKKTK